MLSPHHERVMCPKHAAGTIVGDVTMTGGPWSIAARRNRISHGAPTKSALSALRSNRWPSKRTPRSGRRLSTPRGRRYGWRSTSATPAMPTPLRR